MKGKKFKCKFCNAFECSLTNLGARTQQAAPYHFASSPKCQQAYFKMALLGQLPFKCLSNYFDDANIEPQHRREKKVNGMSICTSKQSKDFFKSGREEYEKLTKTGIPEEQAAEQVVKDFCPIPEPHGITSYFKLIVS